MKKCDLCQNSDKIHYRVNPKFISSGFSVVKNVGRVFLSIMIMPMVVQEI